MFGHAESVFSDCFPPESRTDRQWSASMLSNESSNVQEMFVGNKVHNPILLLCSHLKNGATPPTAVSLCNPANVPYKTCTMQRSDPCTRYPPHQEIPYVLLQEHTQGSRHEYLCQERHASAGGRVGGASSLFSVAQQCLNFLNNCNRELVPSAWRQKIPVPESIIRAWGARVMTHDWERAEMRGK